MITWREGEVRDLLPGWTGVQVLRVDVGGDPVMALAYPDVVGTAGAGDRVLLNVTALERGLGTGGYALVVAIPDRAAAWPGAAEGDSNDGDVTGGESTGGCARPPGHLVKARYTPLQPMVLGVDDPEGEHHAALQEADDLEGMPVLATDLHSALPAVLAGIRAERSDARVAYVMTDGAALPLAWSRTVAGLRDAGWLASTITAGQTFGGDLEAVTVHTALLAARHVVGADVAVIIQGPGNLGTDTRWGFSGVAAGEALNAASVLGGRPVAGVRVSQADARARHRGLSHHSATAFGRVLTRAADLPVPSTVGIMEGSTAVGAPTDSAMTSRAPSTPPHPPQTAALWDGSSLLACLEQVQEQARELVARAPHLTLVEVATEGLPEALEDVPVRLTTMGRGLEDDPAAFLAAAAAGRHAARLLP